MEKITRKKIKKIELGQIKEGNDFEEMLEEELWFGVVFVQNLGSDIKTDEFWFCNGETETGFDIGGAGILD